jgi:hypothetical protein
MKPWFFIYLAVWLGSSNFLWIMACNNLSEIGKANRWKIIILWKIFADEENFTEKGWRYRQWATWSAFIGFVLLAIIMFTAR